MGKRQRHSEFTGLTNQELEALLNDRKSTRSIKRKIRREQKFRGLRNARKRSK